MTRGSRLMTAAVIACLGTSALAQSLPRELAQQLPRGYAVMRSASLTAGQPTRAFTIVALRRPDDDTADKAADRPLLIYARQADGRFTLIARNDHVVLRADEGGQCDPFEEGNIATKGAWFTVENSVACGSHWTDYATFRFDARAGTFLFDNWRGESWSMNPSNDPNADALISDGQKVIHARKEHPVPFAAWRRP